MCVRILWRGFASGNHSWSVCAQNISRALIKLGHQVDIFSTNGIEYFPGDLKNKLSGYTTEQDPTTVYGKFPDKNYDACFSYTALKNTSNYLNHSEKNRFLIWCYEWSGRNSLPTGFAKHHQYCDYLCPPSQFAKQVFLDSGIPENKIRVIPHGINIDDYQQTSIIDLKTKKKFKIGVVLGQNHIRKNIPSLLAAYGKAFTNKDDVCLIIKGKEKPINQRFDVSLNACLKQFYNRFPQHAEIKVYSDFIEDMSMFYRSIDAVFSLSNTECFLFPMLEALASGKVPIAPAWGGQLDFLNSSNALLIEGKESRADPFSMYWESKNNAIWFEPSVNDAVSKLQYAYQNYEKLNAGLGKNKPLIHAQYDWAVIAQKFLTLCI